MKRGVILALLAICGCSREAADGYRFEQSEYAQASVALSVVEHDSIGALRGAAAAAGVRIEGGRGLMAFGVISPDRAHCTIHIVDPASDYRPEWIGHEVAHCLHGRWHG
jgi:hypothetical protein